MKFALLGIDDDVLTLAREVAASDQHHIVSMFEPGEHAAEVRQLAPAVVGNQLWESLLLENVVDAVIVGRAGSPPEVRADQLKKLVQAKVPLIVVHPACEYIVGYEIEMIRSDVGGVVLPYYPGIAHPLLRAMADMIASGETPDHEQQSLGRVEQVVCERRLELRTRETVLAQLARDADLLRQLLGAIKQVSAVGSLDANRGQMTLNVQMMSESGCLARWSLEPQVGPPGATLSLLGARGKSVAMLSAAAPWQLNVSGPVVSERLFAQVQEPADVLLSLQQLLEGTGPQPRTWMDVCRSAEISDTVPRCLARGKTIELYNEEHTEEAAFKGVMAVGGCSIMMLGLLAVFFVAVVEGLKLPLYRYSLWNSWPLYICAVFCFFLLLQFLKFATRKPT